MTTITRERLLTIKQWRETYGPGSNVVLPAEEAEELARIALAAMEAEPVAWMCEDADGREYNARNEFSCGGRGIPLYATPHVQVVPEEMYWQDAPVEGSSKAAAYATVWNACRAAMLQGSQPVSQTYKLPPLSSNEVNDAAWRLHNMLTEHGPLNGHQFNNLKGYFYEALKVAMRNSPVTPDGLSTVCAEAYQVVGVMADALGVFGDAAVQKVLDNLSQQKLVHRDVLPFSLPVTPDGWISCSNRMPEKNQNVLISVNFDSSLVEPLICSARYTGSTFRRGDATIKPGNGIEQATHWMPLPEPPQEVK